MQEPLYGIFLDLRKAYDSMDRGRCVEIMRAYGVGENLLRLLTNFWENAELVCKAGGYYNRESFRAGRGVTQGGPVSPRIFNILVDAVVRDWLWQLIDEGKEDVVANGLGEWAQYLLADFYADDALIQCQEADVLQRMIDTMVDLFERVGLVTNTDKTKAMVCVPGRIRTRLLDEVYANLTEGLVSARRWKKQRVQCDHCGQEMAAGSLERHLETQHDVFRSMVL